MHRWTPIGGDGHEVSGERFTAWALWRHPDDDGDEAEGVMVKFWARRYDRKDPPPRTRRPQTPVHSPHSAPSLKPYLTLRR